MTDRDTWFDNPDMQAAALEGIANNPIAQAYAKARQAGRTEAPDHTTAQGESPELLRYMIHTLVLSAGYHYGDDELARKRELLALLTRDHQDVS